MSGGRSLELFFVDGRPDGMLTAEVFNWTGHVLRIPRTRLSEGLSRKEAGQTGVYILLGDDDDGGLAYIGEAEDMATRLRDHAKLKPWWDQAILVTTSGDALHKAHVKYLESRLVETAQKTANIRLENANAPTRSSLNEAATANMESFLTTLHMILPAIRVDIFKSGQRRFPEDKDRSTPPTAPEFTLRVPKHDLEATAHLIDGEFIVLSGARMARTMAVRDYLGAAQKRRDKADKQGLIKTEANHDILLGDLAFQSPSGAGDFITGRSCNGRLEWKTRDGRTYADWEEEQLQGVVE